MNEKKPYLLQSPMLLQHLLNKELIWDKYYYKYHLEDFDHQIQMMDHIHRHSYDEPYQHYSHQSNIRSIQINLFFYFTFHFNNYSNCMSFYC